jgi:hypothetical protein
MKILRMNYEKETDDELTCFGTLSYLPLHQAVNLIYSVLR